jgi:polyphosphate kinase 2 (PPK2 family)
MAGEKSGNASGLPQRIQSEMVDSFDEELEVEIDDDRLADISDHPEQTTLDRRIYFTELFRLQGELVKLQEWVVQERLKVVVIFEGRDAAGKDG